MLAGRQIDRGTKQSIQTLTDKHTMYVCMCVCRHRPYSLDCHGGAMGVIIVLRRTLWIKRRCEVHDVEIVHVTLTTPT